MRLSGVRTTSLVDGVGINYVIFFQGCCHECKGCHNPESWDADGGYEISFEELIKAIEPYIGFISGITFSGGEPMRQFYSVARLAKWAKANNLNTTLYTGFTFDELMHMLDTNVLDNIDFVIDGKFILEQKCDDVPFRGSSNQNMWYQIDKKEWLLCRRSKNV